MRSVKCLVFLSLLTACNSRTENVGGESVMRQVAKTQASGKGDRSDCNAPSVKRATYQPAACVTSGNCLIEPTGVNRGWLPTRLLPLDQPVPEQIVKLTDKPGLTSDDFKIRSRGAVYGVNPRGGGYGVFFAPDGEENMARFGFGDGWQANFRDGFHGGAWNPTQAGSAWGLGTEAGVERIPRGFRINRYNMPNFYNSNNLDFVENDALLAYSGRDGARPVNGEDKDACREEGLNAELRSEFDFAGEVEDVADALSSKIPAFRFLNYTEYTRLPKSVMQFVVNGQMNAATRMFLSPHLYSEDAATNADASFLMYVWGIRLKEGSPYRFLGYKKRNSTKWDWADLLVKGGDKDGPFLTIDRRPDAHLAQQYVKHVGGKFPRLDQPSIPGVKSFAILATSRDPQTAKAIGIYFPRSSATNRFQTVGVKNDKLVYAEDRLLTAGISAMQVPLSTGTGFNLTVMAITNGLLEPRRTLEGVREGFRSEVYVFSGSPNDVASEIAKVSGEGL